MDIMSSSITKKSFKAGEALMTEGEQGDCAYIIEQGNVEILINKEGNLVQIGTRGSGSIIGEMAMIDDKPRTATIKALEDCEVMEISRDDFRNRLDDSDPILKMVMHVILTRYRDMLSRSQFQVKVPPPGFEAVEDIEQNTAAHDTALETFRIYNELKNAVANDELELFYQPIINLKTGKISGFEALMRWVHPEKGMISPVIFIPVAEESNLIVKMSKWALDRASQDIKELDKYSNAPQFMSVNFSVKDFADESFPKTVKDTVQKHGINPEQIHLEITESLLMEKPELAKDSLGKCHEGGIHISIDDFGTGYSSLSYLHFFPIDTLKVDRCFVSSMFKQDTSMALVKSIVGLAKNLDMLIIAEGIEDLEEAKVLKELGCEYCQGFYFAKPMPLNEVIEFIQNYEIPHIP